MAQQQQERAPKQRTIVDLIGDVILRGDRNLLAEVLPAPFKSMADRMYKRAIFYIANKKELWACTPKSLADCMPGWQSGPRGEVQQQDQGAAGGAG
jgi:hypothetical protein